MTDDSRGLDANFWGAIHGGRFHDPKATRIEAHVTDFWTGESLGRRHAGVVEIKDMPQHSARILVCEHV